MNNLFLITFTNTTDFLQLFAITTNESILEFKADNLYLMKEKLIKDPKYHWFTKDSFEIKEDIASIIYFNTIKKIDDFCKNPTTSIKEIYPYYGEHMGFTVKYWLSAIRNDLLKKELAQINVAFQTNKQLDLEFNQEI